MIKNYGTTIVKIDEATGKESVLAKATSRELAKQATKNLNIAEKIKINRKPIVKEEESKTFFMDKYNKRFI